MKIIFQIFLRNRMAACSILLFGLAIVFQACNNKVVMDEKVLTKLCEMTSIAHRDKSYNEVCFELTKVFNVRRESIRVGEDGIYIVINTFFTTEDGYFISFEGEAELSGKGYDPAFKKIHDCFFKYHISG